jgi:phage shock protein A
MAEAVLVRIRRVIETNVERAVELAERASGPVLMREAVRELERTEDKLRADRDSADARRDRAADAQRQIKAKLAELDDHARYALGKGRDDLARAAVERQVDLESERDGWAGAEAEAKVEARCLDQAIADIAARRQRMAKELAAAQREAAPRAGAGESVQSRVAKAMDRADRMFDRAMAERSPVADPAETAVKMADIAALKRADAVDERLAALKAKAAPAKRKRA